MTCIYFLKHSDELVCVVMLSALNDICQLACETIRGFWGSVFSEVAEIQAEVFEWYIYLYIFE